MLVLFCVCSALASVQTMVQLPGVDVNAVNAQGWTALHVAASLGHEGNRGGGVVFSIGLVLGDFGAMRHAWWASGAARCSVGLGSPWKKISCLAVVHYYLRADYEQQLQQVVPPSMPLTVACYCCCTAFVNLPVPQPLQQCWRAPREQQCQQQTAQAPRPCTTQQQAAGGR